MYLRIPGRLRSIAADVSLLATQREIEAMCNGHEAATTAEEDEEQEPMQKRWMGKTEKAGGASRAWWRHSHHSRCRCRCWEATTILEDLGSGLRLKTTALQATTAPTLPGALEASASAASDKLKSIGQAVDDHDIVAGLLSNLQDRGLRRSSYNSSICTWPWGGIWVNT